MWFACGVNSLTGRSDYGAAAGFWRAGQPAPPLPESRRQPFVQNGRPNAMAGPKRVLLVETDPGFRRRLEEVAGPIADVHAVGDFQAARNALMTGTFELLLTNIRLGAHNGLHLIYLARAAGLALRALAYSDPIDPVLAREAQRAGGFYEPQVRLPYGLAAYIRAELPKEDRRDPGVVDRRGDYRGGRRRSDVPLSGASLAWV